MRDISDAFFAATVAQLQLAFEGQFHYAPFYAYAKLKEQVRVCLFVCNNNRERCASCVH